MPKGHHDDNDDNHKGRSSLHGLQPTNIPLITIGTSETKESDDDDCGSDVAVTTVIKGELLDLEAQVAFVSHGEHREQQQPPHGRPEYISVGFPSLEDTITTTKTLAEVDDRGVLRIQPSSSSTSTSSLERQQNEETKEEFASFLLRHTSVQGGDELIRMDGVNCRPGGEHPQPLPLEELTNQIQLRRQQQQQQQQQQQHKKRSFANRHSKPPQKENPVYSSLIVRTDPSHNNSIPELCCSQAVLMLPPPHYQTSLNVQDGTHEKKKKKTTTIVVGVELTAPSHDATMIRISAIDPHGIFGDSLLQVGDRVLSINQHCCCNHTTTLSTARQVLQQQPPPPRVLSIVTSRTNPRTRPKYSSVSVLYNPHQGNKDGNSTSREERDGLWKSLGITLAIHDEDLWVESITPFGPFCESPIQAGDRVVSIHGIYTRRYCKTKRRRRGNHHHKGNSPPSSNTTAASIVKRIFQKHHKKTRQQQHHNNKQLWTLVTEVSEGGNPSQVVTMITKPTVDSKVGIGLVQRFLQHADDAGGVVIGALERHGLAATASSLLNLGDRVVSINHHHNNSSVDSELRCNSNGAEAAAVAMTMIRTSFPTVTIVTEVAHDTAVVLARHDGIQCTPLLKTQIGCVVTGIVFMVTLIVMIGTVL